MFFWFYLILNVLKDTGQLDPSKTITSRKMQKMELYKILIDSKLVCCLTKTVTIIVGKHFFLKRRPKELALGRITQGSRKT